MTTTEFVDRSKEPAAVLEALLARVEAAPACDEDTVERVARAIGDVAYNGFPWDEMDEFEREEYRDQARAAVAALKGPDTAGQQVQRALDLAAELESMAKTTRTSALPHSRPDRAERARLYADVASSIRAAVAGSRPDDSEAGR